MLVTIKKFLKHRKVALIIVVIILVVVIVGIKVRSNDAVETTSPVVGNLIRTVKISGKVIPQQSVDLSFETAGTVSNIYKEVGDEVKRGNLLVRIVLTYKGAS